MAYLKQDKRTVLRIFIASPGDVREERDRLQGVINDLNQPGGLADQLGCTLQVLDWRDVVPGMGRPEDVILQQMPLDRWDIFVGILWMRFGTPSGGKDSDTGRFYDSGTEEEFYLAYKAWQQSQRPYMLLYRCTAPPPSLNFDLDQLAKVRAFWQEFEVAGKHPGLNQSYQSPADFERRVRNDLAKLLPRLSS